jgi:hypothetical protein
MPPVPVSLAYALPFFIFRLAHLDNASFARRNRLYWGPRFPGLFLLQVCQCCRLPVLLCLYNWLPKRGPWFYLRQVSHHWFVLAFGWSYSSRFTGCHRPPYRFPGASSLLLNISLRDLLGGEFLFFLGTSDRLFCFYFGFHFGPTTNRHIKGHYPQRPIQMEGINTTGCCPVLRGDRSRH